MERTVFFIQHRIRIAVESTPEMEESWRVRVDVERALLTRLEGVLRKLHFEHHMDLERLSNTTVHFGARSGVDLIGRIGLRICDDEAIWVEQLLKVDRERIDEIKEGSAERFDIEKQFSDFVGIAYIFTDYALGGSERYRIYVKSLIEEAHRQNFKLVGGDALRLRILDSADLSDVKTDNSACMLTLPIEMKAEEVIGTLREQWEDLVKEHERVSKAQLEMEALVLSAKRKFRLKSLHWEDSISTAQLQTCVTSIIRHSTQLSRFLEGQRVRISNDYNMDQTDGTIYVRWDFMV